MEKGFSIGHAARTSRKLLRLMCSTRSLFPSCVSLLLTIPAMIQVLCPLSFKFSLLLLTMIPWLQVLCPLLSVASLFSIANYSGYPLSLSIARLSFPLLDTPAVVLCPLSLSLVFLFYC